MQIQNPLKLRVEGLADVQDAQSLTSGMPVIVEPTRPVPPLAVLFGHQAEVTCVAVSRRGRRQAADRLRQRGRHGCASGTATAKQPQVRPVLDHHAGVLAVACTGPQGGRRTWP